MTFISVFRYIVKRKQFVDHDKNPLGSTFPYTNQQPTVFISSNPITCVRLESTTRVKLGKIKIGEGGGGGIHVGAIFAH